VTLATALRLGRVSNLPTVWTNVMAGMALGGAALRPSPAIPIALAVSLLYVAGMYLNDAFDAAWDARHRPERPIPSGEASRGVVLAVGLALLVAGVATLAVVGGAQGAVGGAALAALIVVYDAVHKKTVVAPVIMGACRAAAYVAAALAAGVESLQVRLWVGAAMLLAYVVVVSMIARREATDPRARGLVAPLIAGISLLDGTLLVLTGHPIAAALTVAAYFQTRAWQRHVPGT
jgi:4-hydroxybenzoate polyprenyltransferase